MNYEKFKKFKDRNNLLFGFLINNDQAIVKVLKITEEESIDRGYSDEVKNYRTVRYNCQKTGSVLSKLKINL